MNKLQTYSKLTLVASISAIITGRLGYTIWYLDFFNHYIPYFIMTLTLSISILAFSKSKTYGFAAISGLIIVLTVAELSANFPIVESRTNNISGIRVISFNLLSTNESKDEVRKWLLENLGSGKPTIVFLIEVTGAWSEALIPLKEKLKYSFVAPREDNFGIALYTDLPFAGRPFVRIDSAGTPVLSTWFEWGNQDVSFVGMHPLPPISEFNFQSRNDYFESVHHYIASKANPVILAGDFNSTTWTPNFTKWFSATNGNRLASAFNGFFRTYTWRQLFFMMPIDHVLFTPEFTVREKSIGPHLGSDHRPVVVDF